MRVETHPTAAAADAIRQCYGFGVEERPNAMLERVFYEADPSALRDLAPEQLDVALVWWVSGALVKSSRQTTDGRVVDGRLVLAHWDALPEQAKETFPDHLSATLETLAEAGDVRLERPSDAARALLAGGAEFEEPEKPAPRGPTVKELRERAEHNRARGIQRNGRLYRKPRKQPGDD